MRGFVCNVRSARSTRSEMARGRVAVVVGGGAAGALAAVHLLAAGAPDVVVVDPAPHVGPGVALRTDGPGHAAERAPRAGSHPWRPGALADARRVLLVDTGLTAVDVALELAGARPDREIRAVSRHGLLPQPHRPCAPLPAGCPLPAPVGSAPALWRALPADQRAALLRHAVPFWQVHRHRVPPAAGRAWPSCGRRGRSA